MKRSQSHRELTVQCIGLVLTVRLETAPLPIYKKKGYLHFGGENCSERKSAENHNSIPLEVKVFTLTLQNLLNQCIPYIPGIFHRHWQKWLLTKLNFCGW